MSYDGEIRLVFILLNALTELDRFNVVSVWVLLAVFMLNRYGTSLSVAKVKKGALKPVSGNILHHVSLRKQTYRTSQTKAACSDKIFGRKLFK